MTMDLWPVHQLPRNYPHLEQGSNIVTLTADNGRFMWTSVLKTPPEDFGHFRVGGAFEILPSTRISNDIFHNLTLRKATENGANFLRTHFPDVDVPLGFIREGISRRMQTVFRSSDDGPHSTNLLADIGICDTTGTKTRLLAYPKGTLFRDLCLSPFTSDEAGTVFTSLHLSVKSFETPIQQICASKAAYADSFLAVRTFGYTSLLQVTANNQPSLTEVTAILPADTGDRPLLHFSFSSSPLECFIVNDRGALYKSNVVNGQKYMSSIHSSHFEDNGSEQVEFRRVAQGLDSTRCLYTSRTILSEVDFRSYNTLKLFTMIPQCRHLITSVEDQLQDNMIRLCTTQELLWIDRRFPGKPLLGCIHGREYDWSLEAKTFSSLDSTLVTSKENRMITVYDVSRPDGLIYLDHSPYSLCFGGKGLDRHVGQTILSFLPTDNRPGSCLIRLLEDGSLHGVLVRRNAQSTMLPIDDPMLRMGTFQGVEGSSATQEFVEVNFSLIYERVLNSDCSETFKAMEENIGRHRELLEKMSSTFNGDSHSSHEALHSKTSQIIINFLEREHHFAPPLSRLVPDLQNLHVDSNQYHVVTESHCALSLMGQEEGSREELALDILLSTDISSSQVYSRANSEKSRIEKLTENLSLTDEIHSFTFACFSVDMSSNTGNAAVSGILRGWRTGVPMDITNYHSSIWPGQDVQSQPPVVMGGVQRRGRVDGIDPHDQMCEGGPEMSQQIVSVPFGNRPGKEFKKRQVGF